MSTHARSAVHTAIVPPSSRLYHGMFGRLFPELAPWRLPSYIVSDTESDDYFQDLADTMKEAEGAALDSEIPAGYTYFGQFVDHDITFDPASSLVRQNDPQMLHNFRTPRLDLDNVYASGPGASPHLYEKNESGQTIGRFLLGKGRIYENGEPVGESNEPDLQRNEVGTALIGDPRNDENLIVSQLQLTFLKFHNSLYDQILGDIQALKDTRQEKEEKDKIAYSEARRIVTWTYQYVVWNDFIKRIINQDTWKDVLKLETIGKISRWKLNTCFYNWRNTPFIPVEFSVAAYRFGHSLVRNGYRVNIQTGFQEPEDEIPIFSLSGPDLRGERHLPQGHSVQWDWFLQFPSSIADLNFPQKTRKIDELLAPSLAAIPAGPGGKNALAFLNLKRSWRMGLPSGPDVARFMGLPVIPQGDHEDPLWLYILKESGSHAGTQSGEMLGRVGSAIVGEVFAGLLYGDPNSYINMAPGWKPLDEAVFANHLLVSDELDGDESGEWKLADIIKFAGMPIDGNEINDWIAGT